MSDRELRVDTEGPAAAPRKNGELVFEAPWQGRVFALAHALCDQGKLSWDDFRRKLIARIARWERERSPGSPYHYYEHWLGALEDALAEGGLCSGELLDRRQAELAARPHGHDH